MLSTRRSGADCPDNNGTLTPFIQNEIKMLSSASAQHGGKEQSQNTVLPGGQQVHVEAKSDQSGSSRSWSWSWSSHSSSSSSRTSTTSTSSTSSNDDSHKDSTPVFQSDDNSSTGPRPVNKSDSDGGTSSKPFSPPLREDQPDQVTQAPDPQRQTTHTEVESSHSQHHSNSQHRESTTTKGKDGEVTSHSSSTESSSSSSSSSYSKTTTTTVYNYVISGNNQKANNAAPFTNAQVHWTRPPPLFSAAFSINSPTGQHISRPAQADVCNRRFPFTSQQHTAGDQDRRFNQPFPQEALDPVAKIALDLHNAERARYGLQELQWNAELANMASCWADLKAYGHSDDHFAASGENIAMGLGDPCYTDPMEGMKNAVYSFLDEDRNWAQDPHMSEANGHWTQIVWKETRFVGCAVSQRKDFMPEASQTEKASMYVVCEYYPPGNVEGHFEVQVPASVQPMPHLRSSCSANERHGS